MGSSRVPVGFHGFVSPFAMGSAWVPAGFRGFVLLFAVGSSWVPAWQLAPGWGTGTRYNAKGRLGLAGLRSLLLGFNYIIPQPGMTPFPRNCIGGTKTKGPKGDRRRTEGLDASLCHFFPSPTTSVPFKTPSKGGRKGPKGDRRGTEGLHSAGVWHTRWSCLPSWHNVICAHGPVELLFSKMRFSMMISVCIVLKDVFFYDDLCLFCSQRCIFL